MFPDKQFRPPGARLPIEIYNENPIYAQEHNNQFIDYAEDRFEYDANTIRRQQQIILESQVKEQSHRKSAVSFLLIALVILIVCIFLTVKMPTWIGFWLVGGIVLLIIVFMVHFML